MRTTQTCCSFPCSHLIRTVTVAPAVSPNTNALCFSARLLTPFVRLLQSHPAVGPEALGELVNADPEERYPITLVLELLNGAVFLTGDEDIGLKAARQIVPGDYAPLEYAARSASTWGESIAAVGRYLRLVNDALRFSITSEGPRTLIELDSVVPLPRASADFQSAAFHVSGSHIWAPSFDTQYEVWFKHAAPASLTEYERTFVNGTLRFEATSNGFVVPSELLLLPNPSADPNLHQIMRQYAERMLADLPGASSTTSQVREIVAKRLAQGTPSAPAVARELSMSRRTLARRLEQEGTSFTELLEDVRRCMAMHYVRRTDMSMTEIAYNLGFSQQSAFHRAFRRWTGQTPLEYRRST